MKNRNFHACQLIGQLLLFEWFSFEWMHNRLSLITNNMFLFNPLKPDEIFNF